MTVPVEGLKLLVAPTLGIVVPCFNEESVLPETHARLMELLETMKSKGLVSSRSTVVYIDDGSSDGTWKAIELRSHADGSTSGIKLSRNCGHQNALLCGLMSAPGDILISIDADLQDDLNVIPKMVEAHLAGADIVFGVRVRRDSDGFLKRFTAQTYYRLMQSMNVDLIYNHADFRLLSRRALNALTEYREVNLFLRGMVPLLGFPTAVVEYNRAERFAGHSKYTWFRMLSFAWQGITSFSTTPLRLITALGLLVSLASIGLALWGLAVSLLTDRALPGWASTVIPMYFLGGVQLLSLGVIGEYLSKVYMEGKARPRYHIESLVGSALARTSDQVDP